MAELVDNMNEHLNSLSQDCVEKCATRRGLCFHSFKFHIDWTKKSLNVTVLVKIGCYLLSGIISLRKNIKIKDFFKVRSHLDFQKIGNPVKLLKWSSFVKIVY